jgi:ABC-type glycerol-3-phosphate transport system permease component
MTLRLGRILENIVLYGLLILTSVFMLLPFLWMLSTSLKPPDEIFGFPPILISENMTLNAYRFLIQEYDIFRVLGNTLFMSGSFTLLSLFFCSLGGFGFAKYNFPGRSGLFVFLLATMMIPFVVTMVPLFLIMRDFKWIDTFWPMILPGAANAFGIFFMRQYISSIPNDLLDAARIDGAKEFGIYWRVIVPMIAPGLISLGLIFFMGAWNNFLWPLVILKSPENFTLPLVIRSMTGTVGRTAYDTQMAASIISIIPLLIIFLIFQRRFIEGITAGAIK